MCYLALVDANKGEKMNFKIGTPITVDMLNKAVTVRPLYEHRLQIQIALDDRITILSGTIINESATPFEPSTFMQHLRDFLHLKGSPSLKAFQ